jgi:acetyl-CoA acyltransferase
MERQYAKNLGLQPLAKIRSYTFCGIEPERMGLAPVIAAQAALKNSGLSLKEMGLIEINEAFAAQALAVLKASQSRFFSGEPLGEIRREILNVNGGAIALGHPVGASGARIVVTLAKEMKRRSVQFGLAMICIGGGQGGAMVLERTT